MSEKRIIANFVPQVWTRDIAFAIDGEVQFDVTDAVLAMGKDAALKIQDDQYESDCLWENSEESKTCNHSGPFFVEVEHAIREYYGVE